MALQIVVCTLTTAGIILLVWCVVGAFLLPVMSKNITAVYRASGDADDMEQAVRSVSWLRESGFIDIPMEILDYEMSEMARLRARKLEMEYSFVKFVSE